MAYENIVVENAGQPEELRCSPLRMHWYWPRKRSREAARKPYSCYIRSEPCAAHRIRTVQTINPYIEDVGAVLYTI